MEQNKSLWEILVPKFSNEGLEYALTHHEQWDDQVRRIAGGITILKTAKGQWVNPQGVLYKDVMIPVRIHCTEPDIEKIIDLTIEHYKQEAVFTYIVSSCVKVKYKE